MLIDSVYNLFLYLNIIFESLPISSSGHVKLINQILYKFKIIKEKIKIDEPLEFLMHIPNAIILTMFLWPYYDCLILNLGQNLSKLIYLGLLIFLANLATGVCYYIFKRINKNKFSLTLGFFLTAICLISLYFLPKAVYFKQTVYDISITDSILIGLAQGVALLPGISRLAITYVIGCWLSIDPIISFIFSLTIELPLIIAAVFKALFNVNLKKLRVIKFNLSTIFFILLSSLISYILLIIMLYLIQQNYFWIFGIYMIMPTLVSFKFYDYR